MLARGILYIPVADFATQLTTFRGDPARSCGSVASSSAPSGTRTAAVGRDDDLPGAAHGAGPAPHRLPAQGSGPVAGAGRARCRPVVRSALSSVFARFADKREQQAVISMPPVTSPIERSMWLDYVADLGDGFSSTATDRQPAVGSRRSMSWCRRPGRGRSRPRGTVGAGLDPGDGRRRGLSLRQRTGVRGPHARPVPGGPPLLGGRPAGPLRDPRQPRLVRRAHQLPADLRAGAPDRGLAHGPARSYFAVQLPARWWLLGIDIQLDTYIDGPQLEFFTKLAVERFEEGDAVILCSAKPSWVEASEEKPLAYDTLGLLRAQRGAAARRQRPPFADRGRAPLRPLREPGRGRPQDHRRRRGRLPLGHPPPAVTS